MPVPEEQCSFGAVHVAVYSSDITLCINYIGYFNIIQKLLIVFLFGYANLL